MPEPLSTQDPVEIAKFEAMARMWWDETGPMKVLHRFNPVRLAYLRDLTCRHFGRSLQSLTPLNGLSVLDIGCGGGLLCEPLARMGAKVTGIDPAERNIRIAQQHAEKSDLAISYRPLAAEVLTGEPERFDIVLAMEVIEHVADPAFFVQTCAALVKPGGVLVIATLNRTLRSFALAIVGAEYVLRWLPRGTHDWRKFLTPQEVSQMMENGGLTFQETHGITYNPLRDTWNLSKDTGVNYMTSAIKMA
jgi:2-polyprenyl-6-hydroxyphenyl methylase / 3-demethylubiquinone-9 3-methyltransferase